MLRHIKYFYCSTSTTIPQASAIIVVYNNISPLLHSTNKKCKEKGGFLFSTSIYKIVRAVRVVSVTLYSLFAINSFEKSENQTINADKDISHTAGCD